METPKKFLGYHDLSTLPIRRGDTVTIRKGTRIKATDGKGWRTAGRTYKVRVASVSPGCTTTTVLEGVRKEHHEFNPAVVWVGSGGYWTEADINDIPEAS